MIKAALSLARPVNVLITILSVWIAMLITHAPFTWLTLLLTSLSAGFIMAAGNTVNDYYDVEIDRINKPGRPLPAGQLSAGTAFRLALLEFGMGNALAAFISLPVFLMAFAFSLLIYAYSRWLKRTPVWGNLAVSFSTAAVFVYAALAVDRPEAGIIPALFAFLFHFAREIIKDMEDVHGDTINSARTLPILYGSAAAIRVVWLTFAVLIACTILPYYMGWYGKWYFVTVVAGIWPMLLYAGWRIHQQQNPQTLHRLSELLKLDMLIGLAALYLG